jgi:beta-N-acetylhexosaminidase
VKRKAIIVGIRGIKLSSEEIYLLKKEKPWGVILFSRNIKNLIQLKKLIIDIKNCIKDKNYPILIDQEGGRVSRLNKIIDLSIFSQGFFGNFYKNDRKNFYDYYKIYIDTVCEIIKKVGININTVPVLDVRRKNSHSIIGNRSFSSDASIVSKMGNLCINLYSKNKIATVIKHIPGHGLAKCDSHRKLPVINTKKNELIKKDFIPFKNCKSPFAMTAHVIYSIYDPINTATHSRIVINEIIRKHIGFRGILISDDISMKALRYGLKDNATKALDAGCNLILHSNGNMQEMSKLTKIIPTIDKFTQKKTSHFYNFLR